MFPLGKSSQYAALESSLLLESVRIYFGVLLILSHSSVASPIHKLKNEIFFSLQIWGVNGNCSRSLAKQASSIPLHNLLYLSLAVISVVYNFGLYLPCVFDGEPANLPITHLFLLSSFPFILNLVIDGS